MKIGILSQLKEKNLTGINKMTVGVMREIQKIDEQNQYYLLGKSDWLKLDIDTVPMYQSSDRWGVLNYPVISHKLNVVHSYYKAFDLHDNIPCGKILTINDLIPYIHPDWTSKKLGQYFDTEVRRCAEKADVIIAISEYTKSDIIRYFNIPEDKIRVVYCGLFEEERYQRLQAGKTIDNLKQVDYILSVSAIHLNKNQEGLIKGFLQFKEKRPDCGMKLVLTGPTRNADSIPDDLKKHPNFEKDIIFTGYVTEDELIWLYHNAAAFAYVSFYEGFGLPILEAMAAGKAVICSDTTSMPEVGGDAVEYCNPYDYESIASAMDNVVYNTQRRKYLEEQALIQAKKFSYEKAARQILDIYGEFA